jgi:hypothetical protein
MQGRIEDGIVPSDNTKVLEVADGVTCIVYHNTAVVKWNQRKITLTAPGNPGRGQDGANKTQTTKLRMNQAAHQYGLGYKVVQKRGQWYVLWMNQEIHFCGDRVKLYRGTPQYRN